MILRRKKPFLARLTPFNCDICKFNDKCMFGLARDELHRCGLSIRFEDCAETNGGNVLLGSKAVQV